jgi:hypothetical protein
MASKLISRDLLAVISIALVLFINGCAALQPTDTNGPRSNLPPYPIVANEPAGVERSILAWQQLSQTYGLPSNISADLQPLTGTLNSIPPNSDSSVFLPKVGSNPNQSEEETRESLRRFIAEWHNVLGADPGQLSLVDRTDDASGVKTARYEQRPFRYPLRGNFGKLVIRFQADRRIVGLSSTCLPNTDRLQAALASLTPKVTPENAATLIGQPQISAPDAAGQQHTFTLAANTVVEVRQLVAYVLLSSDKQVLEMHLAWEIDVTNGPIKTIYLDAMSEQVIAVA